MGRAVEDLRMFYPAGAIAPDPALAAPAAREFSPAGSGYGKFPKEPVD
jgi:hypothetical protein